MKNKRKINFFIKLSRSISILAIAFGTTPGCTQYYYNPALPDNLQTQILNQDMAFCNAMASGAVPPQQLVVNNSIPSSTTYGNFNAYSGGNTYSGTYNSYTTYDNSAAQMANMANSMSVIASNMRRDNIYNQCLAGKGWVKVKGKELTAEERDKFGLPPLSTQSAEPSADHFQKIDTTHPDRLQIVFNPLFLTWLQHQSEETKQIVKSGNAYEIIGVLTQFKLSPTARKAARLCPNWKEFPQHAYFKKWIELDKYGEMYQWAINNADSETLLGIYAEFQVRFDEMN